MAKNTSKTQDTSNNPNNNQNNSNLNLETLPILDLDHPGATDQIYKKRREEIAKLAIDFHKNQNGTKNNSKITIKNANYTKKEHQLWEKIGEKLHVLHKKHACQIYKDAFKKLDISTNKIPEIGEINQKLKQFHNFTIEPIHGLVSTRAFFRKFKDKTMLSTQYIRHHSKPEFTPEPDVVHELIGHIPMFTNKQIVDFCQLVGEASVNATDKELEQLSRLMWFTLEYGLIKENNSIKAFGAGLLGGIQDCQNAFKHDTKKIPFNLNEVINTDYNYSFEQPFFFVLESFEQLVQETKNLIKTFKHNQKNK